MNKLIAIATAGCMLIAASAPAIAAPEVSAAPAAAQASPTIGTRAKLVKRASATARGKSNKFLGLAPLEGLLVGVGSLFAVAAGAYAASDGSGSPASS